MGDQQGGAITASYAWGFVSSSDLGTTGGLTANSDDTVTDSYWDTTTSGESFSGGGGVGKTTSDLQTPTDYSGIYTNWNVNTDGVAGADDPWDFGTGSQYPALKADFDGDGTPTAYEFGRQGRSAPVDYDADNDNLIDVNTLAQLNAMRWDLDGNGVSTNAGYTIAFPSPAAGMGCPAACTGYELEADLDFDQNNDDTITGVDAAYWNGGSGWEPIGSDGSASERYNAVFEGNGHIISNLFINRTSTDEVGLFGATGTGSEVRRVGLENVNVTGEEYVGGLAGSAYGYFRYVYTTGSVAGQEDVGGLVGYYDASGKSIAASYSAASVTATGDIAGGLVGEITDGDILASYASGAVRSADTTGGLVGDQQGGSITASYASGAVSSSDLGGHRRPDGE